MIILFLAAIILFIIAIVSFISALIKKKSNKNALIFLIAGVICFFISFAMAPDSPTTEKTGDSNTGEVVDGDEDNDQEEEVYKIGDVIKVSTSNGSYSLTITSVTETDERNEFSDTKADRVIIVDYAYENIDVDDQLYIFESNFKAYDADNNSLETYPADIKSADSISAGRKTTGQMAFALNNSTNKIELEYFDNMFNDSKDCLIVLEW